MPSRTRLTLIDRLIFVWLYRLRPSVLSAVVIVQPETVVRWHRAGFRLYWVWKSRVRGGGCVRGVLAAPRARPVDPPAPYRSRRPRPCRSVRATQPPPPPQLSCCPPRPSSAPDPLFRRSPSPNRDCTSLTPPPSI